MKGDVMEKQIYYVEDIIEILSLSRTKVYNFIKEVYEKKEPFKVLKIGGSYRIPKNSFDSWFNG